MFGMLYIDAVDTAAEPAATESEPISEPAGEDRIKVVFDGEELKFEMPIITKDNYTFYPMRELFNAMEAEVSWEPNTKTASGMRFGKTVAFVIGSKDYTVDGESKTMDAAAFIEDGKTYISIRYAAEGLGYTVNWDAASKTITIE